MGARRESVVPIEAKGPIQKPVAKPIAQAWTGNALRPADPEEPKRHMNFNVRSGKA